MATALGRGRALPTANASSTNSTPALEGIEHRSVDVGGGVTIHVVDARQPPKLGEHTDDMLREASEGEAEIEHPRAGGALA